MEKNYLGNRINTIRTEKNISDFILADKLELSIIKLVQLYNGDYTPDYEMIIKIANALDVSLDELFGREPTIKTIESQIPENKDDTLYVLIAKGNQILEKKQINEEILNKIEINYSGEVLNVECSANLTLNSINEAKVSANTINCNRIKGVISAGTLNCEIVEGSVSVGNMVKCDIIKGNVACGMNVNAETIVGDVKAPNVLCNEKQEKEEDSLESDGVINIII